MSKNVNKQFRLFRNREKKWKEVAHSDVRLPIPRITIYNENGDVHAKKGFLPWDDTGIITTENMSRVQKSGSYSP